MRNITKLRIAVLLSPLVLIYSITGFFGIGVFFAVVTACLTPVFLIAFIYWLFDPKTGAETPAEQAARKSKVQRCYRAWWLTKYWGK